MNTEYSESTESIPTNDQIDRFFRENFEFNLIAMSMLSNGRDLLLSTLLLFKHPSELFEK